MKKVFLLITFSVIIFSVSAQSTWMQKLSYNYTTWNYGDTLTGVKQVEAGLDGSLYVLAVVAPKNNQSVFKFSPNGHHFEWDVSIGYNGMGTSSWSDRILATSDSGIIICRNWLDEMTGSILSYLNKYYKDGSLQWSHQFGNFQGPWNHTIYDAFEKSSGGYSVLVEDSIYTLDASGNGIDSSNVIAGRRFLKMANGDLLVLTGANQLTRTDTTGNIFWSHTCSGKFAYDTANVFILNSNSFIQKVDAITGVQKWNRDYGFTAVSEIEATHDGGFMASVGYKPQGPYSYMAVASPGILFRADSLGDTLWTRIYLLPHYGLPTIKLMPNGNLITGGCYLSGYAMGGYPNEYSAFFCMMNADGSYPLQQTGYVGPLDANNDHISDYVDDALEVMLGLGQTGIPRDTTIYGYPNPCERDDIATDWSTYTNSGVNRKYSDYDGNGVIDTNDIQLCGWCCYYDSFPSLYRKQNQIAEEFCLVPVRDTVAPGEPALFYMVMGNAVNPVDSIYGFAFTYYSALGGGNDRVDSVFTFATGFGTPGTNLFTDHRFIITIYGTNEDRQRTLLCRTDFQNAYGVNDTIGILRYGYVFPHNITPIIRRFKAILADGTVIPFNTCAGTVVVDSSLLSVDEKQNSTFTISPNPATTSLTLHFQSLSEAKSASGGPSPQKISLTIADITGRTIFKEQLPLSLGEGQGVRQHTISTASFAKGIYFVNLFSDEGSAVKKVVIE